MTVQLFFTVLLPIILSYLNQERRGERDRFDAKILNDHPIRTDLAKYGYTFRTEDNYISSYWRKAAKSNISTRDYNESFADPSIIISQQHGIVIEKESDMTEEFLTLVREFFTKIRTLTKDEEKSDSATWHDAHCLATVSMSQMPHVASAIESKCLFLTTDRQIIDLQMADHELKTRIPLALTPSQLMQLFSFSTSSGDYTEVFVTLFSSVSIRKQNLQYDNVIIQEILSRISHYEYYKPEVAERILENQLLKGGYNPNADDLEKEETIYKAISEELLNSLEKKRDDNIRLCENKSDLEETLLQKNKENYRLEVERQRNAELIKIQQNEIELLLEKAVKRKYSFWKLGHIICMIVAGVLFISGAYTSVILIQNYSANLRLVLQRFAIAEQQPEVENRSVFLCAAYRSS